MNIINKEREREETEGGINAEGKRNKEGEKIERERDRRQEKWKGRYIEGET